MGLDVTVVGCVVGSLSWIMARLTFTGRLMMPESTVLPVRETVWKFNSAPEISISMNEQSWS
jgi:hypothetical protein